MNKSKNKSTSSSDVSTEKPPITIEEIDCERRGYKLTDKTLGAGAYAKVKLAYVSPSKKAKHPWLKADLDGKDDNRVAIKIISKKNAPAEYLEKFMPREIDALNATCRHRNVITLYETFRSETKIYLVMEYASKGDLLEFINSKTRRGQPLTEDKAKFLFRQLVLGITHCHQRNVVHRDLKCENVLIDENDLIKVTDFGFATRYPTSKCQFLDTFCGSYAYAAPEILSARKYDGKLADIWSLGVILYAMTCGRLPYNDKSLKYLIEQTKKKVSFPDRVNVSLELRELIQGILVYDANCRMPLHEILFHPWLAMIKVPKQSSSDIATKSGRKMTHNEQEWDKMTPCSTGTVVPERRPRPLGVPRPQKKPRKPPEQSPVQFIVATHRDNAARKSAIPSGTWSPQSSTPEPCHVAKFLRDKNNNDIMKALMTAGPERSPTPVRFCRIASDRQQKSGLGNQTCPSPAAKKAHQGVPGEGNTQQNIAQGNKMTSPRLVQESANKDGTSVKSGVFLRTIHTLYRCKRADNELAEKQNTETEQESVPSNVQQGFLTPLNVDYEHSEKYNFPPVANRSTHQDRVQHQRAASSRLSRLATWRNPLASVRNNKLHFQSRSAKSSSSARSRRSACYEYTNSPLGITRLGKASGGYHEMMESEEEGSFCCRKARENVSQEKRLVSKLTVRVMK